MTKENLNEDQRKKGRETPPKITPPEITEECENMIRRDIDVNDTESNWDNSDKVIEELPDITSPAITEICGNEDNTN